MATKTRNPGWEKAVEGKERKEGRRSLEGGLELRGDVQIVVSVSQSVRRVCQKMHDRIKERRQHSAG